MSRCTTFLFALVLSACATATPPLAQRVEPLPEPEPPPAKRFALDLDGPEPVFGRWPPTELGPSDVPDAALIIIRHTPTELDDAGTTLVPDRLELVWTWRGTAYLAAERTLAGPLVRSGYTAGLPTEYGVSEHLLVWHGDDLFVVVQAADGDLVVERLQGLAPRHDAPAVTSTAIPISQRAWSSPKPRLPKGEAASLLDTFSVRAGLRSDERGVTLVDCTWMAGGGEEGTQRCLSLVSARVWPDISKPAPVTTLDPRVDTSSHGARRPAPAPGYEVMLTPPAADSPDAWVGWEGPAAWCSRPNERVRIGSSSDVFTGDVAWVSYDPPLYFLRYLPSYKGPIEASLFEGCNPEPVANTTTFDVGPGQHWLVMSDDRLALHHRGKLIARWSDAAIGLFLPDSAATLATAQRLVVSTPPRVVDEHPPKIVAARQPAPAGPLAQPLTVVARREVAPGRVLLVPDGLTRRWLARDHTDTRWLSATGDVSVAATIAPSPLRYQFPHAIGARAVLVGTLEGIVALSPDRLAPLWSIPFGARLDVEHKVARPIEPEVLVFTTRAARSADLALHEVFAVDAQSGRELWREPIAGIDEFGLVESYAGLALASAGNALNAYDLMTGKPRWRLEVGSPVRGLDLAGVGLAGDASHIVLVEGGTVSSVDPTTGRYRWRTRIDKNWLDGVIAADGSAYVTTGDGRVVAIDLTTGTIRWRTVALAPANRRSGDADRHELGPVALVGAAGAFVVVTDNGALRVFDRQTGGLAYAEPASTSTSSITLLADGDLLHIAYADAPTTLLTLGRPSP